MAAYLPQDWPDAVRPPGSEDFEASAVAWLLDVLPADFRRHPVLRRYPAALASMALHHARACVHGAASKRRGTCWACRTCGDTYRPRSSC